MERKLLKQNARELLKGNSTPFVLAGLVYIGLAIIFMVPYMFCIMKMSDLIGSHNFLPFILFYLVFLAFMIVVPPVMTMAYVKTLRQLAISKTSVPAADTTAGLTPESSGKLSFRSYINNIRGSACGIGNFWWTYLWIWLWTMVCVLPFVILSTIFMGITSRTGGDMKLSLAILLFALYIVMLIILVNRTIAYQMNWFVLADNPKVGAIEAMNQSKKLTKKHKWELFVLDLSFIGWWLLTFITCGIAGLWLLPYYGMTKYNAYKDLSAEAAEAEARAAPEAVEKSE